MLKSLTKKDFKSKVENSEKISLVKFSTSWCAPCKALKPAFEELSKEIKELNFFDVDVDKEQELAVKFSVMSVPTILILKKRLEIGRINGFSSKESLKSEILKKIK